MSLWPTITYDATGLHAWTENLSSTGRRQATSVAASKLRQWVNGTNEERPSRGEIKAWDLLVLNERRELHNRVEALTKENEALTAQRDGLIEDLAAERSAHDADVAGLGDRRDTLRGMLRQAQCERDRLRAELQAHVAWASSRAPAPHTPGGGEK